MRGGVGVGGKGDGSGRLKPRLQSQGGEVFLVDGEVVGGPLEVEDLIEWDGAGFGEPFGGGVEGAEGEGGVGESGDLA